MHYGFRLKKAEKIRAFRLSETIIQRFGSFAYEPIKSAFKCKKIDKANLLTPPKPMIREANCPVFNSMLYR